MDNTKKLNTAQKLLLDLNYLCPITMIVENAKVTREELLKVIEGKENFETFTQLLSLWCFLDAQRNKDIEIENSLGELELSSVFDFPSPDTFTNYADKHGV